MSEDIGTSAFRSALVLDHGFRDRQITLPYNTLPTPWRGDSNTFDLMIYTIPQDKNSVTSQEWLIRRPLLLPSSEDRSTW